MRVCRASIAGPVSPPADPLLENAARVLQELRERCAAGAEVGDGAADLLIDGYASALALEGARRRLREQALDASERELRLATQERELRTLLGTLRARLAGADRSAHEPAPQRLD